MIEFWCLQQHVTEFWWYYLKIEDCSPHSRFLCCCSTSNRFECIECVEENFSSFESNCFSFEITINRITSKLFLFKNFHFHYFLHFIDHEVNMDSNWSTNHWPIVQLHEQQQRKMYSLDHERKERLQIKSRLAKENRKQLAMITSSNSYSIIMHIYFLVFQFRTRLFTAINDIERLLHFGWFSSIQLHVDVA